MSDDNADDAVELLDYEDLTTQLQRVPSTWLPGLLTTTVQQCVRQRIFQEGGLERMVAAAKRAAERSD